MLIMYLSETDDILILTLLWVPYKNFKST